MQPNRGALPLVPNDEPLTHAFNRERVIVPQQAKSPVLPEVFDTLPQVAVNTRSGIHVPYRMASPGMQMPFVVNPADFPKG